MHSATLDILVQPLSTERQNAEAGALSRVVVAVAVSPVIKRVEIGAAVELRRGVTAVDVTPVDDGVAVTLEPIDGGSRQTLRADYVIAADGAGSRTRERLGIERRSRGGVLVEAAIDRLERGRDPIPFVERRLQGGCNLGDGRRARDTE